MKAAADKDSFETGCCPRFHPGPWQEKELVFDQKRFLKDRVKSIFHVPLNFGTVMERDMAMIERTGAKTDAFVLTDENSLWGADVYIGVDKDVPGAEMTRMSGTVLTKVFEGPYAKMNRFANEMDAYVKSKNKHVQKTLFGYPYCPKCAKAYGTNYIVILAQV